MCGIFGAVKLEGNFDDELINTFDKAVSLVSHRGPDSQGSKIFYNNLSKPYLYLGHRRLSIIDLSSEANQPMEDDGIWIVFNGEIFNYVEIKENLKKLGHKFKTDSDTEVILKTYLQYGTEGFHRFNGMWAFILFDSKNNKIIASRDRFSIKPLYYFEQDGAIFFSSELRQILLLSKKRKPNIKTLNTFLLQSVRDHDLETFYEEIYKIPAKSSMVIDLNNKSRNIIKYWNYGSSTIYTEDQAIEKFHETIENSIRLRLRSDVEIGCLLSGGLDSSLISALSNKIGVNPIRTFSVISNDKKENEEEFIDIMVKEGKLLNRKIHFDPEQAVHYIDKCLFYQEQPFSTASVVAQFMIYELIRSKDNIKVVLSGQGGDETLMGYLKYFFFYLNSLKKEKKYFQALKEIFFSLAYRTAIVQFELSSAKRYMPVLLSRQSSYLKINSDSLVKIWDANSIQERQINDIDHYSVPALTHYEDRNSMAHSIESRTPFLDHEVVNFLVHLPVHLKYKNGWSKYLLRKASHDLPNKIRWRRDKKGFTVPEAKWCKTLLKDEIEKIGQKSILEEIGVLDGKAFREYFKKFLEGSKFTNSKEVFSVLMAEKWLKTFH
ncbi:MAG: asparagine synthase (glutamine-hydrolyzing) [Bacteroidetes bacterium]|nr:asparagine synthase (glutamine-hydrolyzing) [Bacteroidota bacterium]